MHIILRAVISDMLTATHLRIMQLYTLAGAGRHAKASRWRANDIEMVNNSLSKKLHVGSVHQATGLPVCASQDWCASKPPVQAWWVGTLIHTIADAAAQSAVL